MSAHRRGQPDLQVIGWPTRAQLRQRLPRLVLGVALLGVGVGMTVEARLGLSPYDVLHQGIANRTGISFGVVVILVGVLVLLAWIPLRQRPGIGTVVNTLCAGLAIDLVLALVPEQERLLTRIPLLVGGTVVVALGMGLYIGAGLGPGPRDGLMTGIAARGHPLWLVRTGLEVAALGLGWVLGGDVGVGTVLFAFWIGPLGHWFLARLHLGVDGRDPDPDARVGE